MRLVNTSPAPANAPLTLARVDADADRDVPGGKGRYKIKRTPYRLGGCVEECENAVAGVVGADTAVAGEHRVDESVVVVQLMSPMCIAASAELFCRTDDIGEHHGLEYALFCRGTWGIAHEIHYVRGKIVDNVGEIVRAWRE